MEKNLSVFENIWLADDDQDDQLVFEKTVRQLSPSTHLTLFNDCVSLLLELKTDRPDLLFLDVNMPGINGKECLKRIKDLPSLAKLPVIILSGSTHSVDVLASYGFGAALYVIKPFSDTDWTNLLSGIFRLPWEDPEAITTNQYQNNRFVPYRAE